MLRIAFVGPQHVWITLLCVLTVPQQNGAWTRPVEPFRIIDNIYYVGTEDLASYLVTSATGHVLIDSGVQQNAAVIAAGIQKLGFELRDVQSLLTTQGHFDHVAAHAELQRLTGATVIASAGDAPLLESGGKADYHFSGADTEFPPVRVDRRIKEGDVVTVGDGQLTAHITPGHTQGTTTWSIPVKDESGRTLIAVFVGSTSVNPGVKLVGNAKYPQIAADYASSFTRLRDMTVEVFLTAHLSANNGLDKAARLRAGRKPNPFIDPGGFRTYIEGSRARFEAELARQKH